MIARGGSRNGVHLGYKLEVPQEPGEAQKVLGIGVEGSYVISAKVRVNVVDTVCVVLDEFGVKLHGADAS